VKPPQRRPASSWATQWTCPVHVTAWRRALEASTLSTALARVHRTRDLRPPRDVAPDTVTQRFPHQALRGDHLLVNLGRMLGVWLRDGGPLLRRIAWPGPSPMSTIVGKVLVAHPVLPRIYVYHPQAVDVVCDVTGRRLTSWP